MTKMISVLVEVLIFASLIGTIATLITSASNNENMSALAVTIVTLVTGFIAIGFLLNIMKKLGITTGSKR